MRLTILALLLASACTQRTPESAPAANAVSNVFAEMDAAATPAYDAANAASAINPDRPMVSPPLAPDDPAADRPIESSGASCGADKLQGLVGKPRSAIPGSLPERTRITCTTCPVTMDYSAQRLNIFYGQQSGIIEEVRCG